MAISVAGASNNNAVAFATTGITVYPQGTTAAVIFYTAVLANGAARGVIMTGPDQNTDDVDTLNMYDSTRVPGMWNSAGGADSKGSTGLTLSHWGIVAVGKDTGTVAPRCHVFDFTTGVWSHGNGSLSLADSPSTGALNYSVNGSMTGTFFGIDGSIAAAATWTKRNLSDSEIERLAAGSWNRYSPDVLIEFPSGRTVIGAGPLDHGRQRMKTSNFGSAITRAARADPPGFKFSPMGRRR